MFRGGPSWLTVRSGQLGWFFFHQSPATTECSNVFTSIKCSNLLVKAIGSLCVVCRCCMMLCFVLPSKQPMNSPATCVAGGENPREFPQVNLFGINIGFRGFLPLIKPWSHVMIPWYLMVFCSPNDLPVFPNYSGHGLRLRATWLGGRRQGFPTGFDHPFNGGSQVITMGFNAKSWYVLVHDLDDVWWFGVPLKFRKPPNLKSSTPKIAESECKAIFQAII